MGNYLSNGLERRKLLDRFAIGDNPGYPKGTGFYRGQRAPQQFRIVPSLRELCRMVISQIAHFRNRYYGYDGSQVICLG